MLQNRDLDIDEFISFNSAGVSIADYDQIQSALVRRYKNVYGNDIDVANTTADGIFINNLALIINNILQSFKIVYSNLNVDTASGEYLDMLCRLSNVTRKRSTKSIVYVELTCSSDTELDSNTEFIDNKGVLWIYEGDRISITEGEDPIIVKLTCEEYGPVEALAGSITQTVSNGNIIVDQPNDAILGTNNETDEELRARRDQSNGSQGITILDSLVGALLAVEGINDVQVINNNTQVSETMTDTTSIDPHSIYVIIRKRENVEINDEENVIGNIIYNTLTPGIATTQFEGSSDNGEDKHLVISLDDYISDLTNTVYWKESKGIAEHIQFKITKGRNYSDNTTINIITEIINYLNNIHLSQQPTENDIIITGTYADINAAYVISDVDLSQVSTNPNTYYNYINDYSGTDTDHVKVTDNLDNTLTVDLEPPSNP